MKVNQLNVSLLAALVVAGFGFAAKPTPIPAELVGKWQFGTINSVWFEDRSTGEYKGHGGGVSAYFQFDKSGRFKHHVYIETNTNGWKTQVFTTMEGTVVAEGNVFRLNVEKGAYRSRSNTVEKHNYDRPMSDAERLEQSKKPYLWKAVYGEGGSQTLDITIGGKGAPSTFRPSR